MRGPLAGELTRLPEVGLVAKGELQAVMRATATMRTANRRMPMKFNLAIVVTLAPSRSGWVSYRRTGGESLP